ncbi:MAG TPA: hypothetical protein VLJ59_02220 [Mycobacteriales bacterium]|nr:hypothetical protein [Mycobacteriales bacterium]
MSDLGANQFTFVGYGVRIVFTTETPGPVMQGKEGGVLEYHSADGNRVFTGQSEIARQEGPLGTLVTVVLRPRGDTGGLTATVLIPQVSGVTREAGVDFDTVLIRAASRGNLQGPGPALTYTVTDLRATARSVILPL